jgi:hypothetical protein
VLNRDIVLLGMKDEIMPIDLEYLDEFEAELVTGFVYHVAYNELVSRTLKDMAEWSSRAMTLFETHRMERIRDIIHMTKNEVNRLSGGGYVTRKEIYDVFRLHGIIMPNWMPGHYYERMNYKFT